MCFITLPQVKGWYSCSFPHGSATSCRAMAHLFLALTLVAAGAAAGVAGAGAGAGAAGFAVPLNLDGMVRPPARSISLVPANDVPARIAMAGKLQQRLQFLG